MPGWGYDGKFYIMYTVYTFYRNFLSDKMPTLIIITNPKWVMRFKTFKENGLYTKTLLLGVVSCMRWT